MANLDHLQILEKGVVTWNEWRHENPKVIPDLSRADLGGGIFEGANLARVNFNEADIQQANFDGSIFRGANLRKADLSETYLRWTDLSNADFSGACLRKAVLSNSRLEKTNFEGAYLHAAGLREVSLSEANLKDANVTDAYLSRAFLSKTNLCGADFTGAHLAYASFLEVDITKTRFEDCYVYGLSAWDLRIDNETVQRNLRITPPEQPRITIDNLEVAQFIYLLLKNEKLRHVINTITTKVVLILGRFTPERKVVLDTIRDELRKYNYVPVVFDFNKPATRDTHETITTLARLARFVVADITEPQSIPQELVSVVESMPSLPVQPLLKNGSEPWGMFDHIRRYPWVLPIHHYDQVDDLLTSLGDKVIAPAEAKAKESQAA